MLKKKKGVWVFVYVLAQNPIIYSSTHKNAHTGTNSILNKVILTKKNQEGTDKIYKCFTRRFFY